ncbi:hypothetical protein F5Y15DRAFT_392261 [Xylariaceae sp. FL0016]|nr:hypothetical protein F5Y15DRAFT_392261 [Xylariaceae sp. FL0016]
MSAASALLNGQAAQSGASPLDAHARRLLEHYHAVDSERQGFIQSMLHKISEDEDNIKRLTLDLEDQRQSRQAYQNQSMTLQNELQRVNNRLGNDTFVVVLVDGDGAKFADDYLQDPIDGARRAAMALTQAVRESLRATDHGHDVQILVRVYANLNDLSKSLRLSRVTSQDDDMRLFAENFTNTRADFDFVNVGKGKENADSKMRRMLNHYYKNMQCQKIFLAGVCHDNGYLHDLRDFTGDSSNKLSLVETTPAEPGFKSLGFPILRFNGVFRSAPLGNETRRVAQAMPIRKLTPPFFSPAPLSRPSQSMINPPPGFVSPPSTNDVTPSSPELHHSTSPIQTPSSIKAPSPAPPSAPTSAPPQPSVAYTPIQAPEQNPPLGPARVANVVKSSNGGMSISYATAGGASDYQNVTVKSNKPKKQPKVAYYNVEQCRVDPPTQHPPKGPAQETYQQKFSAIKPSVFCNDFYLKGHCKWGLKCDKTHDVELTKDEVAIHRYKARTSLCPNTPYCADYECYLSHHCPRNPCKLGSTCPFYRHHKHGDLHLSSEQRRPATKWTEGINFPEQLQ